MISGGKFAEAHGNPWLVWPGYLSSKVVPISGTQVREQPYRSWHEIPSVVRPYFLKRVCVSGVDSVSRSNLVRHLTRVYDMSYVPAYGRIYEKNFGGSIASEDILRIIRGQQAAEQAAAKTANHVPFGRSSELICDQC